MNLGGPGKTIIGLFKSRFAGALSTTTAISSRSKPFLKFDNLITRTCFGNAVSEEGERIAAGETDIGFGSIDIVQHIHACDPNP